MAEVIIFFVFLICIFLLSVTEIIFGIGLLRKKHKHKQTLEQSARFRRNTILLTAVILLAGVFVTVSQLKAETPTIKDKNGKVIKGSIAELEKININGRNEWISVRGSNKENPILLFLAGGPGGTQMAAVRHDLSGLEKHFVVVVWDQPGSGKSYSSGGKDLTVDTYIEDGITLTEYLCGRFDQDKIYLVGESWGSALSVMLAAELPDRYHAVIGTGQMIDFLETENLDYDKAIEIAESKNDSKKLRKLKDNGRPPYNGSDVTQKSAEYLNYLSSYMNSNPEIHNNGYQTFRDIFSAEYGIIDKINYLRGILRTFNHVYSQLYGIDLRSDYSKLEVPIYFFIGRHDINAPASLVEEYKTIAVAPRKEIIWFENSGHSPWINESDKFVSELETIMNAAE